MGIAYRASPLRGRYGWLRVVLELDSACAVDEVDKNGGLSFHGRSLPVVCYLEDAAGGGVERKRRGLIVVPFVVMTGGPMVKTALVDEVRPGLDTYSV
jgi:hypothetical protein